MNFQEAVKEMRKGNHVRLSNWKDCVDSYMIDSSGNVTYSGGEDCPLSLFHFEAINWKVDNKKVKDMYQVMLNGGLNYATEDHEKAKARAWDLIATHKDVKIIYPEVQK